MTLTMTSRNAKSPLRSPLLGMIWLSWWPYRRIAALLAAYTGALAVVFHNLGTSFHFAHLLLFPIVWGVLYLLAAFIGLDADLGSMESAYPRHMLHLPVTTRSLVALPMLCGVATIALTWTLPAWFVLRPMGIHAPVGWPALTFGALLATSQVLAWSPMPMRFLRGILALIFLPLIAVFGILGVLHVAGPALEYGVNATIIVIAFLSGSKAVVIARRGDTPQWTLLSPEKSRALFTLDLPEKGFRSPAAAQIWFEWRRHGSSLPFLCGMMFLLTLPLVFFHVTVRLGGYPSWSHGILGIRVSGWVQGLLDFSILPLLFAIVPSGSAKGKSWRQDIRASAFGAARPQTSAQLVSARLQTAAISAVVAWSISAAVIGVALSLPASDHTHVGLLFTLALHYMTPRSWMAVIVAAFAALALTWKFQADSLFTELSGEPWLAQWVYPFAASTLIPLLIALPTLAIDYPATLHRAAGEIPSAIHMAALIKLPLAILLPWTLARRGLIARTALARIVLVWSAVAVSLFAAIHSLVPSSIASAWTIAATVFLMMPAVRISLAPLAWEWNRHR